MSERTQTILTSGPPPEEARAAVILLHGRGGRADGMLTISHVLNVPRVSWVAPQAAQGAWYPESGRAPLNLNRSALYSSFRLLSAIIDALGERGISPGKTMLLGFSQGACVAVEYVRRYPGRIGALAALSGGLMGPVGSRWRTLHPLKGLPVYLGSSELDPYIWKSRAQDTARALARTGASVRSDIFPGSEHRINDNELDAVRRLLEYLIRPASIPDKL